VFEEMVRGQGPAVRTLRSLLPRAREIAATLDLDWSDSFLLRDAFEIGIADAQLLLLARALNHRPKVLILDEPTSTLSAAETDRLFTLVRRLRDEGVAIMYVTHRLSEVRALADDLVVLREGRLQQEQSSPFDLSSAVEAMLGKSIQMEIGELLEQCGTDTALELRGIPLLPSTT